MEDPMTEMTPVIDRYFALWNEPDPGRRRDLIAQTFTEDASYVSPQFAAEGHDGISVLAQNLADHLAGYRFLRTGEIDAHHDHLRFTWEVVPPEGQPRFAAGVNFGVLADDGRLRTLTGFLDQAPPFEGGHHED
jgi:hypothetical protein